MNKNNKIVHIQLRPHHLCCSNYLGEFDPARGTEYKKVKQMITSAWNQENIEFEVKEGPDILCQACTYFNGASCIHPKGDEKAVRKWDRAILDGLCLNYNQVIKIKDLKSLIISKIPIDFCSSKCQYHKEKRCNPHQIADCLK